MSTATLTRAVADTAARPALRAAIYVRISDDKAGRGLGVERQREDTGRLVERKGYRVVGVYDDNDISAYSGKPRPGYIRLVEDIRAGLIDVIVTYRADRLYRLARELEDLIDLLDDSRMIVDTVESGEVDLATTSGRRMARIHGAIAQGESEDIRDKVRRAMIQNAEMGKPHGALRSYGLAGARVGNGHVWETVGHEVAVIEEAARRILAGEAMHAIVKDLNRREIPAPKGGVWHVQTMKNILVSPRVAGWRSHTPGLDRNAPAHFGGGEFTAPAEWPAILDRETVERIRRILGDPSRRRGPSGRTYLLSGGLARCGLCGGNLAGQATHGGRRTYRCSVAGGGCGRLMIGADAFEGFVVEAVREAHRSGRFDATVRDAEADTGGAEAVALVESLRAELDDNARMLREREITRPQFVALNAGTMADLAAAEADLDRRQEREATALLAGGLDVFDRAWAEDEAAGNLGRMRARLLAAVGPAGVVVGSAVRGRKAFDPERIAFPEWSA